MSTELLFTLSFINIIIIVILYLRRKKRKDIEWQKYYYNRFTVCENCFAVCERKNGCWCMRN